MQEEIRPQQNPEPELDEGDYEDEVPLESLDEDFEEF
jgi:hypothetical protein